MKFIIKGNTVYLYIWNCFKNRMKFATVEGNAIKISGIFPKNIIVLWMIDKENGF